ncbi:MAG: 50S ribosomal protein L22 [Candidatus Woesearchaeota archaeon]
MAQHNYSYQKSEENIAKAVGRNLDISPKQATEICKYVRGKPLNKAKMLLQQAIDMKRAVPFTRFTNGLGHKPGMSAGRYNPKACSQILKILKSAEANAKNRGYNSADLKVVHLSMQIGARNSHYGRQRKSIFKNSNIEVVLQEVKGIAKGDVKKDSKTEAKVNAKKIDSQKVDTKKDAHAHDEYSKHVKKDN